MKCQSPFSGKVNKKHRQSVVCWHRELANANDIADVSSIRYHYKKIIIKGQLMIVLFNIIKLGPRQAKTYLRACAKCADSHHPARAQSRIRVSIYVLYSIQ